MNPPGLRIRSSRARQAAALCLLLVAWRPSPARAECGMPTPDYEASRRVMVGDNEIRLRVHVSGSKTREESEQGGATHTTIRGLPGGRVVIFDTQAGQGTELPSPSGARLPGRAMDEVRPDGTRTHIQQVERGSRWLELSRTTCRPDGVMLRQSFVSLDPQGKEVVGSVVQDNIRLGLQSPSMFQVPPEVRIARPGTRARGSEAAK